CVPVLLVVVDQPRIRRRCDHAVEPRAEVELARIAVQHLGRSRSRAHAREVTDALERVERVSLQKLPSLADRLARPPVLVTPVLRSLRCPRKVEVEMGRPPRRAPRPREHHPEYIRVLVVAEEPAE